MIKNVLKYLFTILLIPLTVFLGVALFPERSYAIISIAVVFLACVPFFLSFERKNSSTRRIVLLAVMTAFSVAGRFIFAPIPFFKPVTAIVIISGMYFGSEFGFLTGTLTALISNFYFGQGPWTPFQMFSWGIIGFIAGIIANPLIKSKLLLAVYGALSGVAYSLMMDVWTTIWSDGAFNPLRFYGAVISALPITLQYYVISNIIFLLIFTPLFSKKIERLKNKYGI
ncbi:MAG: ECF transporter S component [Ruminococcus sp.]|nr:ECF transporter S component [Ruminococcus sp.]